MNLPRAEDVPQDWRWPRSVMGDDAVSCLASALAAVAPGPVVERALSGLGAARFSHLVALGKAAVPMADAATRWQVARGDSWRASVVVAPEGGPSSGSGLAIVHGDHPVPGQHSAAAAAALGALAGGVTADSHVLLLLSGGTSSLAGAPITDVSLESLQQIFRMLLNSGLDIHQSNMIRKRFLRWGGGRLAEALAPASIHALAISDVPGDDPATIGSGPVSPDGSTAADVADLLRKRRLTLPHDAAAVLAAVQRGEAPDLPAGSAPCFRRVTLEVIASNTTALEAAASTARLLGYVTEVDAGGLRGEARDVGARLAQRLRVMPRGQRSAVIVGGETTVTIESSAGTGGRNQEVALSAAKELAGASDIALLAAATDGKDGNSPNAGGLVDGRTWKQTGNGAELLQTHSSAAALAAAGAELWTGPTGTNVMDVVVGLKA
jgi:glycerate-2-kinase